MQYNICDKKTKTYLN